MVKPTRSAYKMHIPRWVSVIVLSLTSETERSSLPDSSFLTRLGGMMFSRNSCWIVSVRVFCRMISSCCLRTCTRCRSLFLVLISFEYFPKHKMTPIQNTMMLVFMYSLIVIRYIEAPSSNSALSCKIMGNEKP